MMKFRLEEAQKMKKRVRKPGDVYFYDGYDYVPSGKLMLIIKDLTWTGARQRWRDTEKNRIGSGMGTGREVPL